jgi:hypothetical protein
MCVCGGGGRREERKAERETLMIVMKMIKLLSV